MAVRFIIGRAGSGKSRHCFESIVRESRADPLGPPTYWILPRQATFQAQRQLVCQSGLPAVSRAMVLSFSQLGRLVCQQCGGIAIPETSAAGRQMILGHLLRTHQERLHFYRSVARQPGLAAELDAAFAELERYGKSADDILASDVDESRGDGRAASATDPHLAKLQDLRLLYAEYTRYLGQDRLDQHRRLQQVIECLAEWPALRESLVFVDGFFDFAEQERQLLAALARSCASVEITLLMDPGAPIVQNPLQRPGVMDLFHRTEQTYRRLWESFRAEGIRIDSPLLLPGAQQAAAPLLQRLERDFFAGSANNRTETVGDGGEKGEGAAFHLIQAPSRRAEVDAVARHVRALLVGGLRLRDIAVLAPDLSAYQDLIAASFAEHALPCFIDRRRRAAHHPLVRFTRLLPTLAGGRWPHESMVGLLKCGLLPISSTEADELENYALAHRIRGSAWVSEEPWAFRTVRSKANPAQAAEEEAALERINAVRRRAFAPVLPLAALLKTTNALPVKQIVEAMSGVFESAHIRRTLANWITSAQANGELEQAASHEQIWNEMTGLLDQMVDLLDQAPVTPAEFTDILETGLEQFDLALTPPTVDQILVGTVDRTRTPAQKAVVLIGWHEGGFPRRPAAGTILTDDDRAHLSVGGTAERLLLDERLLAYYATTRATEHLCITRPCADDAGKLLSPSPFWFRIENLFPDATRTIVGRSCDEDCIGTPRELTTALMRWARDPDVAIDQTAPWPSLYQWFVTRPLDGGTLDQMRARSWPALRYSNEAKLSPPIANRLLCSPLRGSIARIESFAACPFQHFAGHVLALRQRPQASVTALDMSQLYHAVLRNVVGEMIRTRRDWSDPSPRTAALVHAQTRAVGKQLRDAIMLSNARNEYLLDRAQRTLQQVMAAQEAAIRRGGFQPAKVDVHFGGESHLPAFSVNTPGGNRVELSGTIDRIDIVQSAPGAQASDHVSAVDYRLRSEALPLDRVYHGLSLQLLTYLLVLEANGHALVGRPLTPAAAFYVRLLRQLEDVRHPADALSPEDPAFDLQVKPRGIFDAKLIRELDSQLIAGASDVVQVYVNKDGGIGKRQSSDAAGTNEFTVLLRLVRSRIGELVDRLLSGDIRVWPVRIRHESPCARCDFRSVCRFDPAVNRYRALEALSREEVFSRLDSEVR
jgi:ATP-dependent helicase/nuclease subunit B